MSTQYLNLDELVADEKVLVIKGQHHPLMPVSVETFVRNVKLVQELGTNPGFDKEVETIVKMLGDAFPSVGEAEFRKMPLDHLNKILSFAQDNDGTNAVDEAAKAEAAANPQ